MKTRIFVKIDDFIASNEELKKDLEKSKNIKYVLLEGETDYPEDERALTSWTLKK